jgi:TRAP-type C4-dicarboxylate transport system permease small subunit
VPTPTRRTDAGEGRTSVLRYVLTFRWANVLSEVAGLLSAAALLAATGIMLHAVMSRYLLGRPTVWQTELSIYLLMFVAFVGAAYGLKHHAHVGVDLLVDRLQDRGRLIVRVITTTLVLLLVCAVAWTAGHEWHEAYEGGWRSPTAWRAPLSVVYAILPIGMVLVACQLMAFLIEGVMALLGRGDPHQAAALLSQGHAELSAATGSSVAGITDEALDRPAGDAGPGPARATGVQREQT